MSETPDDLKRALTWLRARYAEPLICPPTAQLIHYEWGVFPYELCQDVMDAVCASLPALSGDPELYASKLLVRASLVSGMRVALEQWFASVQTTDDSGVYFAAPLENHVVEHVVNQLTFAANAFEKFVANATGSSVAIRDTPLYELIASRRGGAPSPKTRTDAREFFPSRPSAEWRGVTQVTQMRRAIVRAVFRIVRARAFVHRDPVVWDQVVALEPPQSFAHAAMGTLVRLYDNTTACTWAQIRAICADVRAEWFDLDQGHTEAFDTLLDQMEIAHDAPTELHINRIRGWLNARAATHAVMPACCDDGANIDEFYVRTNEPPTSLHAFIDTLCVSTPIGDEPLNAPLVWMHTLAMPEAAETHESGTRIRVIVEGTRQPPGYLAPNVDVMELDVDRESVTVLPERTRRVGLVVLNCTSTRVALSSVVARIPDAPRLKLITPPESTVQCSLDAASIRWLVQRAEVTLAPTVTLTMGRLAPVETGAVIHCTAPQLLALHEVVRATTWVVDKFYEPLAFTAPIAHLVVCDVQPGAEIESISPPDTIEYKCPAWNITTSLVDQRSTHMRFHAPHSATVAGVRQMRSLVSRARALTTEVEVVFHHADEFALQLALRLINDTISDPQRAFFILTDTTDNWTNRVVQGCVNARMRHSSDRVHTQLSHDERATIHTIGASGWSIGSHINSPPLPSSSQ